jgi:hypothetical protein
MRFSKVFLVFFSLFFVFLLNFSFSHRAFALTYLEDVDITSDTTWSKAESPYVISGRLNIFASTTLTIEPGVSVKLFERANIKGDGSFKSLGTKEETINFSSIYDAYGGDIINDCDQVITPENTGSGVGQCTNDKIFEDYYNWGWGGIEIYGGEVDFRNTNIYHTEEEFFVGDSNSVYFDGLRFDKSKEALTFYNSSAIIKNSVISDMGQYPLTIFENSKIGLENVELYNNGLEVDVFDNGQLTANNLLIDGVRNGSGLYVSYDSLATLSSTTIKNIKNYNGVDVFAGGHLYMKDSVIENILNSSGSGIDIFSWPSQPLSTVDLLNVSLSGGEGSGVEASKNVQINISKSKINNFKGTGIEISDGAKVIVDNSDISKNNIGVFENTWDDELAGSLLEINNSSISNNIVAGVSGLSSAISLKAVGNYWGDASGPYNTTLNATGTGNSVADGVEFIPWLTEDPTKEAKNTCCSNVVFIPGLQASRLYTKGLLSENQLWEPNRNQDVEWLYLDENGKSLYDVYTRDIIERTNVGAGVLDSNVYKSFADMMDGLVSEKKINAWEALPYDWRMDLNKIVNEPVKLENGKTYNIIDEIIKTASSSQTGKVSIVTHSNGGLVAKTLINELKKRGKESLIDELIMVASPELGTPTAVASLLHGDEQEILKGFLVKKSTARTLGENMMGAYNLLPSEEYFKKVASPVIEFDASVDKFKNYRTIYGDNIDSASELKDFLLGKDGRVEPADTDTTTPNVLKALMLSLAKTNHNVIDNLAIPENIKVTELAGWGVSTIRGIKYIGKEVCVPDRTGCFKVNTFDRKPLYTSEGDQTVVAPSATVGSSTYYLDLRNLKNVHKNILEASSTLDFVKNILLNSSSTLPEYIAKEKPVSTDKTLELSLHSPVSIDVYDSTGRHTGLINNPNPNSDLQAVEENIPGSRYMEFGEGKYVLLDEGTAYIVKLQGLDVGTFTFEANTLSSGGVTLSSSEFVDIPTSSDMKGEIQVSATSTGSSSVSIKIDVNGDGKNDFTINPNADFDPIIYLQILRKTVETFSASAKTKNEIYKKIDTIIKSLQKNKTKSAIIKIKQFSKDFAINQKHQTEEIDKKHKGDRDIKNDRKKKKLNLTDSETMLQMLSQLLNNLI